MPFARDLAARVEELMRKEGRWTSNLSREIPVGWEMHKYMVIVGKHCFRDSAFDEAGEKLWKLVCDIFKVRTIVRQISKIHDDDYRTPQMEILYGPDTWTCKIENKIEYHWPVRKCMFSRGNLTEKMRIAQIDCRGKVVVDLFAGIGYFTLTYLVHCKADLVVACDWNPDALEALQVNLVKNHVADRCLIFSGDCKQVCPHQIADYVNLGLLPHARREWETGCKALKRTGGILLIHENAENGDLFGSFRPPEDWMEFCENPGVTFGLAWGTPIAKEIKRTLESWYKEKWNVKIRKVFLVKDFSPYAKHVVLELSCKSLSVLVTKMPYQIECPVYIKELLLKRLAYDEHGLSLANLAISLGGVS